MSQPDIPFSRSVSAEAAATSPTVTRPMDHNQTAGPSIPAMSRPFSTFCPTAISVISLRNRCNRARWRRMAEPT